MFQHSIVFVTWRLAGTLPQPAPELLCGETIRHEYDLFASRWLKISDSRPCQPAVRQDGGGILEERIFRSLDLIGQRLSGLSGRVALVERLEEHRRQDRRRYGIAATRAGRQTS